jgi:hypothetical protein
MRIDLCTRCCNDLHRLGFFFRRYDQLVQRCSYSTTVRLTALSMIATLVVIALPVVFRKAAGGGEEHMLAAE